MRTQAILLLLSLVVPTAFGSVGYSISFYFASTPTANCSTQFNQIRDAVYNGYVVEMINKTSVTLSQVMSVDSTWSARRLQSQQQFLRGEAAAIVSDDQHRRRRLTNCSPATCAKGPYEIRLRGCTNCRRRRELAVKSTSIATPDPDRAYGSKTSRISDTKGSTAVSQFYQYVDDNITSTDPCRAQLNSLLYQLDELDFY